MVCIDKPSLNQETNCNKECLVYRAECTLCRGQYLDRVAEEEEMDGGGDGEEGQGVVEYVGETCKSLYQRGLKHIDNYRLLNQDSFILRHHIDAHPDLQLGKLQFRFQVVQFHETAMRRQLSEAIEIKFSSTSNKKSLNNKLEYNRSILPNLCDQEPTQAEKDAERKLVGRIKDAKEKWVDLDKKGRRLLNKEERKNFNRKRGMPNITWADLESIDQKTIRNKELKDLIMGQNQPLERTAFYEDLRLEDLHTKIVTKELAGDLFLETKTESVEEEIIEVELEEMIHLEERLQVLRGGLEAD